MYCIESGNIFDLKKVIFIQFQKDSLNAKFVNTMEQIMRADLSGVREKVTQQFSTNEQLIDKVPYNLITEKI